MSARRNFLKNFSMAIVASLLPRVLQPGVPELEEEEKYFLQVKIFNYTQYPLGYEDSYFISHEKFEVSKATYELIQNADNLGRVLTEKHIL